ncbi:MAG TPA: hypothetical protein DEB09_05930 [Candidatus Magasanikbacteria bacterium]|nr:hypothetical protein [Candidatus Magasanikbacteria bacterium]
MDKDGVPGALVMRDRERRGRNVYLRESDQKKIILRITAISVLAMHGFNKVVLSTMMAIVMAPTKFF